MAKKQQEPDSKIYVTISDGRRKVRLETWRYWEIVGELRWMGADYPQAVDAAKWCQRAKPGDINRVDDILMEVTDGKTDRQK